MPYVIGILLIVAWKLADPVDNFSATGWSRILICSAIVLTITLLRTDKK